MTTQSPSDPRPDALAPYRASIRREMRRRGCDSIAALVFCSARCGKAHEEILERLLSAHRQIEQKEATR